MSQDFYDRIEQRVDEEIVRRAEEDLKWLMSTEQGRRLAHRFLDATGQQVTSFVNGDPYGTAFNEGRRYAGLSLLRDIRRLCPELEFAMTMENAPK